MAMTITADDVIRDLLMNPDAQRDPYPLYRALHETAPFHKSANDGYWYISDYEACKELLRDPRIGHDEEKMFRRPGMTEAQKERLRKRMEERKQRGFSMITENPPDHTRMRRLVSRAFTTPRMEGLRDRVVTLVDGLIDKMADQGECDLMMEFAFPMPVTVIGELLGVPEPERERFRPLVRDGMMADRPDATEEQIAEAEKTFEELDRFFRALIAERRADPQDDLISALAAVTDEQDGRLSEEEMVSTIFLLFFAGFVTTTNLVGNGTLALFRNPDQMDRLWADGSLVPTAVDEFLRYDGPVTFIMRDVLEPVQYNDSPFTVGDHLVLLTAGANRDPKIFADPDALDIGRPGPQPLSFGWGIHHCLGAPLARMEGQVAFARLRERFSRIELLEEPQRVYSFLRGLRSMQVRVTPR